MLKIPHCLDKRLTDGSNTGHTLLPSKIIIFSVSGTHFCWWLSEPQGLVQPEGLGKLKKKITSPGFEPATCSRNM
jgi:hypothetical protein